jgi:hypothetical protein
VLAAALSASAGAGVAVVAVDAVVGAATVVVALVVVVVSARVVVAATGVVVNDAVVALGPVAIGSPPAGSATSFAEAIPPNPSSASEVARRARRSTGSR